MQRTHCDICDSTDVSNDHLWAGLDVKDPLRDVSAKIQFSTPKKQELDLCRKCRERWLTALVNRLNE